MEIKFFEDESNSIIKSDLFSKIAEDWAINVCKSGLNARGDKLEKNKISQIRKFYDEALNIKELLKAGEDYRLVFPYIKMLNAKAAYAEGRKLITREFKEFICKSLMQVKENNKKSFEVFLSFFEAFMGYYKFEESKYKK